MLQTIGVRVGPARRRGTTARCDNAMRSVPAAPRTTSGPTRYRAHETDSNTATEHEACAPRCAEERSTTTRRRLRLVAHGALLHLASLSEGAGSRGSDLPSAATDRARAKALSAADLAYWRAKDAVRAPTEAFISEDAATRRAGQATYDLAFAYGLVPRRRIRAGCSKSRKYSSVRPRGRLAERCGHSDMGGMTGDYGDARNGRRSVRCTVSGDACGWWTNSAVGSASRELGELDTARSCFMETLQGLAPIGYRTAIAITLDNLAALETRLGHHIRALRLAGAAEALTEAAGGQVPPEFADLPDLRQAARASHPEERIAAAWAEGRAMSLDEAIEYARQSACDDQGSER